MRFAPFFLLPLLLILLLSCNQQEITPAKCRDGKCTHFFQTSQELVIDTLGDHTTINILPGNQTVFSYEYIKKDSPEIADDEYTEQVFFAVPDSLTDFSYSDSQLVSANLYFLSYCYCVNKMGYITQGTLNGHKLNNDRWEIDLEVTIERDGLTQDLSITEVFQLKP